MKKLFFLQITLSILLIIFTFVSFTRLYMIGNGLADYTIIAGGLILTGLSIYSYVKNKKKIDFIFIMIGLSPILYFLLLLILVGLQIIPFAP